MPTLPVLDRIPIWAFLLLTFAIVLIAIELGFRIAGYRKKVNEAAQAPVGSISAATLGLLGFMLAFTFGIAATRFDTRRQLILTESNAIATTYLRAGYIAEPERTEIRRLLREYVNLRAKRATAEQIQHLLDASNQLQDLMWAQAVQVATKTPNDVVSLFIDSLNQVIDLHSERVFAALMSRIPSPIWLALGTLTILAMISLGYMAGIGGGRCPVVTTTLALGFTAVIFLIVDLDRPSEGFVQVNLQPMVDLQQRLAETTRGHQ